MTSSNRSRSIARVGPLMATLALALSMTACGGDGGTPAPVEPPAAPARGSVIEAAVVPNLSLPKAGVDALTQAAGLAALAGPAQCNVAVHSVRYNTRDPLNAAQTASTAVLVPGGGDPAVCEGERPVLLYARGTDVKKSKNMADWQKEQETALMIAFFAARGFIVVLPNYLGHDTSSLPYHPFLNAEAQAVDVVDALRAAKAHLAAGSATRPSQKLFIAGYSQGGHVAMATHRAIERDYRSEFTVTASAPMSGPYNMVAFGDVIASRAQERINDGATILLTLVLTSYQKSYGNIYGSPSQAYNTPYDATAETLFPTDTALDALVAQGKLPADGKAVWDPAAGALLRDSFRTAYPTSNFRRALQLNTLLDWTPQHPMALCGGAQDPVVFFDINTPPAQAAFAARGVQVPAFDLEDRGSLPAGAAADAIARSFTARKAEGGNYHAGLVAPHCIALAKEFFAKF